MRDISTKYSWTQYSSSGPIRGEYCGHLTNRSSPGVDDGPDGEAGLDPDWGQAGHGEGDALGGAGGQLHHLAVVTRGQA